MFLDDAVGHRKPSPVPCLALSRRSLGGEERIVDALNVLRRDAAARCRRRRTLTPSPLAVATRSVPPPGMASLRVQEQVQEHLLQLPGLPWIGGRCPASSSSHLDLARVLNWCSSSASVSVMTLFRSTSVNSVPLVREKFSRLLTISEARNVCRVIFSSSAAFLRIALQLLGQHLRVGGNHRQRRVHFVRHARRQQSDRRKLVGLRELRFQFDALGDVVHDDQPADHVELLRDQRRDGHVDDARSRPPACSAGTCTGCGCPDSAARGRTLPRTPPGKLRSAAGSAPASAAARTSLPSASSRSRRGLPGRPPARPR